MRKLLISLFAVVVLASAAFAQQVFNNPGGNALRTNATVGLAGTLTGAVNFTGVTSGTAIITAQAVAGAPTLALGTTSGTLAGSASSPLTINSTTGVITCSTCGITSNPLSQFAATTSAQLAGVISDETGTGVLVFATAPTFTTSITDPLVIGGTAAGSTLSLRSTSGVGTTDQILFQVGNNGATLGGLINTDGRWNVGTTNSAPDSLLVVNANTGVTVAPNAGTYFHVVGADAANPRMLLDGFGGVPVMNIRRANGTRASKTAIANADTLFAFGVAGWDTAAYGDSTSINFLASETFTSSAHGGYIEFYTTPTGTTATAAAGRFQASGGLSIGATADPGTGGLYVNGATITLNGLATDATHTDRTVCQDSTSKSLFFGSGAVGICLGTSGAQFKTAFAPMVAGLDEVVKLNLQNYRYRDGYGDNGARVQYGLTAQDVEAVIPDLARHNLQGETINYDWGALVFVSLRAIQQLKADNDNLVQRIDMLERRAAAGGR